LVRAVAGDQKFTQKERDIESGLDYFGVRYFSSAQGRFTSPDEFVGGPDELFDFADQASANPTFYADLTDPQSLNKYQYCYNNPLLYIDPNGHQGLKKLFDKAVEAGKQVVADTVNGAAKTAYNAVISGPNTVNTILDAGLSLTGSSFRFGTYQYAQPETPGEKGAMLAGDIVLLYVAAKGASPEAGAEAAPRAAGRAAEGTTAEAATSRPGSYAPDRPLPRDAASGKPVPESSAPHTQLGRRTSRRTGETYTQGREFGHEGQHVRDVDFTNHGRKDHTNPHQHRIDPQTGKRGQNEPLQ
jgi:RHS repeat-associated protein